MTFSAIELNPPIQLISIIKFDRSALNQNFLCKNIDILETSLMTNIQYDFRGINQTITKILLLTTKLTDQQNLQLKVEKMSVKMPSSSEILFKNVLAVIFILIFGCVALIQKYVRYPTHRGFFCDDETLKHPYLEVIVCQGIRDRILQLIQDNYLL